MTEIEDQAFPAGKEDEWLAVRCQLGERAAFDELIERYQGPLWRYVAGLPRMRMPRAR